MQLDDVLERNKAGWSESLGHSPESPPRTEMLALREASRESRGFSGQSFPHLSASAVPWHHNVLTVALRALLVNCTVLGFKPQPGEQPLELGPSTPQGFEAKHLICQSVRWSGQRSALAQASSDLVSGK